MKNSLDGSVCTKSEFDVGLSGKKICFDNGLEFEVVNRYEFRGAPGLYGLQLINYDALRVLADKKVHQGTYELWIVSYYVNKTNNDLWSFKNTSLTITIGSLFKDIDCNR